MNNKYICVKAYPGVPKGSIAVDFESRMWHNSRYDIIFNQCNLGCYSKEYFKNKYWVEYGKIPLLKKFYLKIYDFLKKKDKVDILLNCDIDSLVLSKKSIIDPEINKSCVFKAGEIFNIGFDIGSDKVVGDIIEIDYYKCRVLECNHKDLIHKVKIIK
jgi:hypothetical protein